MDITADIPLPSASAVVKPKPRRKKAPSLPAVERRNWLIHTHYVRKEWQTCKTLIQEQLKETNGQCEYAVYIQAMIMRSEGWIQQSMELFQACHLLNPTNPDNLKQIARNLILLGKHKSAIECYNRASELSERDWDICHCLGLCYHFLKDYDKAEQCFIESLKLNRHTVTYNMLAKLYLETGNHDKAMDVLSKGVEFSPENTDLLTLLGLLHLRKSSFHKAFELLGQAMTFDQENYKAILAAGSMMQKHGDFDVALSKYRVAAHAVPESSSLWNNIAMCFFGKKKYVAAISCLKRANYLSPFDWKILYNLCLLHLTMQQYASAFHFCSTAISLKQDHGPLYMLLAVALTNLGQEENAEKAYEEAIRLNGSDVHTVLNYCVFLHNRSKSKQAAKLLSSLQKNMPTDKADINKEVIELNKKLTAALNVGDKIVAEKEKSEKKKKHKDKAPKTSTPAPFSPTSAQPPPNEIDGMPSPATSSLPSVVQSKLPPLRSRPSGEIKPPKYDITKPDTDDDVLSRLPTAPTHDPYAGKQSRKAVAE
ncbi:BBSome complex member BBS4 [Ciona intestinalis]